MSYLLEVHTAPTASDKQHDMDGPRFYENRNLSLLMSYLVNVFTAPTASEKQRDMDGSL